MTIGVTCPLSSSGTCYTYTLESTHTGAQLPRAHAQVVKQLAVILAIALVHACGVCALESSVSRAPLCQDSHGSAQQNQYAHH